jgi:hypothetical protein
MFSSDIARPVSRSGSIRIDRETMTKASTFKVERDRVRLRGQARGAVMYARIVRFTDVDPDHLASRLAESDSPPVETAATAVQVFHDADQRTAVVIQQFDSADDMAAAESAFDAMDPSETPGTRASIDRSELKAEMS